MNCGPSNGNTTMTPAETTRFLALVSVICPPEGTRAMAAEEWYPQVADLPATETLTATILLARRRCDVTPHDVRAEVFAMRGRRLRPGPSDAEKGDPQRARALQVPCPWCGALPRDPCTVPGSDIRLHKSPAHPVRILIAEGTTHVR
jgi:hypothetical protein